MSLGAPGAKCGHCWICDLPAVTIDECGREVQLRGAVSEVDEPIIRDVEAVNIATYLRN